MRLKGLHHLHLKVRDLAGTLAFTQDFGLTSAGEENGLVYLHGSGSAVYQLVLEEAAKSQLAALAFELDDDADLSELEIRHGQSFVPLGGPGKGRAITLMDPEGNSIRLVTGMETREADPLPPLMTHNQGAQKERRGVWQHKPPLGAPPLMRLGHVGLFIRDWAACDKWYRETLRLIPSDLLYAGAPQNIIGGFYRIDRGDEWVDHHTIAFFAMGKSDLHHVSFEVPNPETQFMGHRWMTHKQHESVWGVGRHPLGSHVFDVWRDPSGYRFETFSDTDLCNASIPTTSHSIADASMDLWSDRHVDAYFA
ncbi:VOC family protein [Sphingobium sp. HWE2-09]|uniref:VOC family protein n=1 Tax=Sphingobium sp. HWE2-09 TaxID=3108390 RepID=UPI002DC92924|nr:VOC family protein [Sphingobium sp. HWE2-09]